MELHVVHAISEVPFCISHYKYFFSKKNQRINLSDVGLEFRLSPLERVSPDGARLEMRSQYVGI